MRILLWHVHGSWATAFVQGAHEYVVPVTPDRGPDGLGRARTWDWPRTVRELIPQQLGAEPFDAVVLQRPAELALAEQYKTEVPSMAGFTDAVANARARTGKLGAKWPETAKVIYTGMQLVLTGQAAPADAMAKAGAS